MECVVLYSCMLIVMLCDVCLRLADVWCCTVVYPLPFNSPAILARTSFNLQTLPVALLRPILTNSLPTPGALSVGLITTRNPGAILSSTSIACLHSLALIWILTLFANLASKSPIGRVGDRVIPVEERVVPLEKSMKRIEQSSGSLEIRAR